MSPPQGAKILEQPEKSVVFSMKPTGDQLDYNPLRYRRKQTILGVDSMFATCLLTCYVTWSIQETCINKNYLSCYTYLWPRTGEGRTRACCRGDEIGGTAQCREPPRRQCEVSGGMRGDWSSAPHGDRSKQALKDRACTTCTTRRYSQSISPEC